MLLLCFFFFCCCYCNCFCCCCCCQVVIMGDGQATQGDFVVKPNVKKASRFIRGGEKGGLHQRERRGEGRAPPWGKEGEGVQVPGWSKAGWGL
jgi:hypothetical protein